MRVDAHDQADVVDDYVADEVGHEFALAEQVDVGEPDHGVERERHAECKVDVDERHRVRLHGHIIAKSRNVFLNILFYFFNFN